MGVDQRDIDAAGDQRFERRAEAIKTPALPSASTLSQIRGGTIEMGFSPSTKGRSVCSPHSAGATSKILSPGSIHIHEIFVGDFAGRCSMMNLRSLIKCYIYSQSGGWGGIRTHGGLAPAPVFKTGALNRSATHPARLG